jgi:hypothetical protein
MNHDKFYIPPISTPAETLPLPLHFKGLPACEWRVNDIVMLQREGTSVLFRIKAIQRNRASVALTFVLWNCAGGRTDSETLMPRKWKPIARGY